MEANKRLITYSIFGVGFLFIFFIGSYLVLKGVISRVENTATNMAETMPLKLIKSYQEKIDANTKKRILARITRNAQSYYELANYYRSQNMYGDAENYYKEAIFAQPEEEQPYIELAEFYRSVGRNDDAIKIYQKLFKVNPDNPKAFTEVKGYYKTLLSQQPLNEDLYLTLARVYEKGGYELQAIETYQNLLVLNPDDTRATYRLKKLTLGQSPGTNAPVYEVLTKEGIAEIINQLKANQPPQNADAPVHEVVTREPSVSPDESTGKFESAVEVYQRTAQIDPNNPKAFEEIEDYYKKLIKTSPDAEENYLEMGKVYDLANRRDAAAKVYKKLLKIHKENKTANMKLIDYYKSESPKKAVEYYENLIALEPQQENYYLELAALYNSFGKKDRAFKIYQTLLAVNPNSERAKSEILNSVLAGIKN